MAVNWNLLGQPTNVLESLQVLGAAQDRARQDAEREAKAEKDRAEAARLAQFQGALGAAIDPATGRVDGQAARLAYIGSGNAEGAIKFSRDQATDYGARRKAVADPFANAAWEVLQLPPEQQAQAFYRYVDQFSQQHPDAAQFRDIEPELIPQFLKSLLAETGHLDDFMKSTAPDQVVIPAEGEVATFQYGRRIDQQQGAPAGFAGWPDDDGGPTPPASGNFR